MQRIAAVDVASAPTPLEELGMPGSALETYLESVRTPTTWVRIDKVEERESQPSLFDVLPAMLARYRFTVKREPSAMRP